MSTSLLQRIVRVVRDMNYANRRVVELRAPWLG